MRIAVGLGLTFLLAGTAAVAIPLVQSLGDPARTAAGTTRAVPPAPAPQPSPAASEAMIAFACPVDPQDHDYCRRAADDMIRRTPLTDAQRADADRASEQVLAVLPDGARGSRCSTDRPGALCRLEVSPPSSSEVRQALTAAGYRDALVRVARPDDPAPRGSVLVAVPAGAACVVIHHNGYPHRTVAGRLPDGSCLSG